MCGRRSEACVLGVIPLSQVQPDCGLRLRLRLGAAKDQLFAWRLWHCMFLACSSLPWSRTNTRTPSKCFRFNLRSLQNFNQLSPPRSRRLSCFVRLSFRLPLFSAFLCIMSREIEMPSVLMRGTKSSLLSLTLDNCLEGKWN